MVAAALVAPEARDFEIYRLVEIAGASTREVAALFELSQTRIVQLRDRVAAWVSQQKPVDQRTKEQRLQLAQWEAGERLRFLYQSALQAWRASQGTETIEQKSMHGGTLITKRASQGKTAYLLVALRIAERLAKLPLLSLTSAEAATGSITPSEEDCSPAVASPLPEAQTVVQSDAATCDDAESYEEEDACGTEAEPVLSALFAPVQPAAEPVMNRRQRRRREREKARTLRARRVS